MMMENLRIALSVKALFQKLYVALLAAITLCCVMPAFGQTGRFFCGGGSQLSTAMVNHIMQDKRGFIWISTSNGLNIYNGYDFRILKADGSDGSLLSNQVNCINQMPNGRIYVGTSRGLQYIKDGKFVNALIPRGSLSPNTLHSFFSPRTALSMAESQTPMVCSASAKMGKSHEFSPLCVASPA